MRTQPKIKRINPFATQFIRPGEIEFLFEKGSDSIDSLVYRFDTELGKRAAIIGPHGCGKTTLAKSLIKALGRTRNVVWCTIEPMSKWLPSQRWLRSPAIKGSLLVVDGFEQLSWWRRRLILQESKSARIELLVTAHRKIGGIPVLWEVRPSVEILWQIVERLQGASANITFEDVRAGYESNGRNIRETLFWLYDRYQEIKGQTPWDGDHAGG